MRKIILRGLLYDFFIEPLLKRTKEWIAEFIIHHDLLPALDICSGTGRQCQLVAKGKSGIFGLDLDLKMIKYASSNYPQISFVCADASHIPFKKESFNAVIISYSLHDKPPDMRTKIMKEVKRLLTPTGKIVLLDFEKPWNRLSRLGNLLTWSIERMAGGEHYRNSRQFLMDGGLQTFVNSNGLQAIEKHNIPIANSSILISQYKSFL